MRPVGDGESGAYRLGWDQNQGQYFKAQGDELRPDETRREEAIYKKRKWVAEQVFGQIKAGMGFQEFTMRGEDITRAQWLFACAVHNVMKAVRHISGQRKEIALPMNC